MTRFPHAPIWLPLTVAADPGVIAALFITLPTPSPRAWCSPASPSCSVAAGAG